MNMKEFRETSARELKSQMKEFGAEVAEFKYTFFSKEEELKDDEIEIIVRVRPKKLTEE